MSLEKTLKEINSHLSRYLTPALKWFIVIPVVLLILQYTVFLIFGINHFILGFFSAIPFKILLRLQVWRLGTYIFLHVNGIHLLFNMLALWFFAPELEIKWGTKKFVFFFFIVGVGAGVIHTIFVFIQAVIRGGLGGEFFKIILMQPMIGASGVVYGVLVANLIYFADRTVLYNFMLPMKMKYFVIIMIVLEFFSTIGSASFISGMPDNISHITHLGGALIAFLFIKCPDIFNHIKYGGRKNYSNSRFKDFQD